MNMEEVLIESARRMGKSEDYIQKTLTQLSLTLGMGSPLRSIQVPPGSEEATIQRFTDAATEMDNDPSLYAAVYINNRIELAKLRKSN